MSGNSAMEGVLKASDAAFAMVALGTLAKLLPALAALLSCIWYLIRISEWAARKWRGKPAAIEPAGED